MLNILHKVPESYCVLIRNESDGFYHVRIWEEGIDKMFYNYREAATRAIQIANSYGTYAVFEGNLVNPEDVYDFMEELYDC